MSGYPAPASSRRVCATTSSSTSIVTTRRWSPAISASSAALYPVPAPTSRIFIPSPTSRSSSILATSDACEVELAGSPSMCRVASAVSA